MKITKSKLRQIIKEELGRVLGQKIINEAGEHGVSYEVDVERSRFDMDSDAIPVPAQSEVKKVVEARLLINGPKMGAPFVIEFDHMVMFLQKDLGMPDTSEHGYMATDRSKTAAKRALRHFAKEQFGYMAGDIAGVPYPATQSANEAVPLGNYAMRYGYGVSMYNLRQTHTLGFGLVSPYFDLKRDVQDPREEAAKGKRFPLK